ncbi:hypothetical protein, partial [Pseudomonas rhodesiae]|uniref:hypothetical protein n=1 Tax=Pseudomonas rhodesiae TaxID=76760 RepID=UPI001E2B244E
LPQGIGGILEIYSRAAFYLSTTIKCGRGLAPDSGGEVRPKSWTPIQLLGLFHEQVHDAVQAFRHYCFS